MGAVFDARRMRRVRPLGLVGDSETSDKPPSIAHAKAGIA
jgi:hypothetical protein